MMNFQFDPRMVFPEMNQLERIDPYAVRLFDRARLISSRRSWRARIMRKSRALLSLDDVRRTRRIVNQHAAGVQMVLLSQIRGTAGRAGDFDAEFYPKQDRTETRWERIASALLRGESVPPVELIQVGEVYYVVDGHHRVSVSRCLKQSHMDASVTVWELA